MLSWFEHEKSFIISRPVSLLLCPINVAPMFDNDVCASDVAISLLFLFDPCLNLENSVNTQICSLLQISQF